MYVQEIKCKESYEPNAVDKEKMPKRRAHGCCAPRVRIGRTLIRRPLTGRDVFVGYQLTDEEEEIDNLNHTKEGEKLDDDND